MDLVDLVFVNKEYYRQISGGAMGISLASSIANLFVADSENIFIFNAEANPFFITFFIIKDTLMTFGLLLILRVSVQFS